MTKARKKTKIDFQRIMAATRSAMALRTMASTTRIRKKLSPQINQNQATRRKSRQILCRQINAIGFQIRRHIANNVSHLQR